jgi:FtsX-like permease family
MKMVRRPGPMLVWAARDMLRHPVYGMMLFAGLTTTIALVAVLLLLSEGLTQTCRRLLAGSPAVVVRRVDAGGWAPLPMEEALHSAGRVAGVLRPRTRIWGVVNTGTGRPVMVVGWSPHDLGGAARGSAFNKSHPLDSMEAGDGWHPPQAGQVVLGPGVKLSAPDRMTLVGRTDLTLEVVGRLPVVSGLAAFDLAVVHADDARSLLGLESGQASDLVLDVFRREEIEALCNTLADAFPWPVQIMTRQSREGVCLSAVARHGGFGLVGFVPLLTAMAVLVLAVGVWGHRRRWTMGLYKALGWTGRDILRMQVRAAMLVAGPAAVAGLGIGYGLICLPGMTWVAELIFGWSPPAPMLSLSVPGLAGPFALTLVLTVAPFLCACFWVGWQAVVTDPGEMM